MQGVRWSEEDLKAHKLRLAGHKPVPAAARPAPAAPALVPADATTDPRAKARDEAKAVVEEKQACGSAGAGGSHEPRPGARAVAAERVSRGGSRPGSAAGERRLIQPKARPCALAGDVTGGERPAPKSKRKLNRPEQDLQIQQVEFLDWALVAPWRFLHVPNGGYRTPAEAAIMKAMGQKEGAADILFLGPRWPFVWIENKSLKGTLSDPQKEWRDWCHSIGAPWFLCRSLDDLVAACADAGVPLRGTPQ